MNRISVEFINSYAANQFVNNKVLSNKGYKLFIPLNFVTSKGIARGIDTDITEEELLKCCSIDGKIEILNAKRLNRKVMKDDGVSYAPTGTVLFTFKGVNLPREVHFYNLVFKVQIYISPVTQCYRCLRYGHTKNNCKGNEKCFNCGESKHQEKGEEFACQIKCFYCKEEHKSISKKCPEHNRQKNIKELMAFENITFFEASELCKRSYIPKGDYVFNGDEFPKLNKRTNISFSQRTLESTIEPSQRRTASFRNPTKRTYQQVASNNNNKKRMILHKSYNKKDHDENLYAPNGRYNDYPTQSWISQQTPNSQNAHAHQSSTSAISNNNYNSNTFKENINLESIIHFIKNAPMQQTEILKEILWNQNQIPYFMEAELDSDF